MDHNQSEMSDDEMMTSVMNAGCAISATDESAM